MSAASQVVFPAEPFGWMQMINRRFPVFGVVVADFFMT
ncbi:hypothetical protein OPIT5_00375 (plasmid) [Opitutaceae bacterium TAV5]|nr:hypothetical protein OPIT5_00375 [Opitutaceae bacterium TAV5]